MRENDTTLQSYEAHVQEYIDGTPQEVSGHVKEWLDRALSLVPKDGHVLELGSAFGRDAIYVEQQGYQVQRTDATQGFVDLLNNQGHDARLLNAITGDFGSGWNLIFANAVLLHFTPEETEVVLKKAHESLAENGIFAFTVKQGEGSGWSEEKLGAPRYFNYWDTESLQSLLTSTGFGDVEVNDGNDGHSHSNAKWIHVIAHKQQV